MAISRLLAIRSITASREWPTDDSQLHPKVHPIAGGGIENVKQNRAPMSQNVSLPSRMTATYRPILGGEDMGRREYQNPSVLTRKSKFGLEYYIRYRVKVLKRVEGQVQKVPVEKMLALGLCKEMTLRQAERKKAEHMKTINGQVYHIQSEIPFCDFVAIYKERYLPTLKVTTQRNYKAILKNFIEPYFSNKKLCDIKPEHVHQFITGLELAPLTRKTVKGLLSGIYTLAIHWGYWEKQSPVKMAFLARELPETRVREKRIWTPAELQQILMAVRPDVRLMIETLVWTGMRISECLGLRWKNVNLEAGYAKVEERQSRGDVDRPKSKRARRTLPLGALLDCYRAIKAGAQGEDFVFVRKDGATYHDCELLANYLTPILEKLNLKFSGAGFHTFRRMHLTWFSESGATAFEAQQQAGHSSMETTMLYVLPDLERRKAVVEAMQMEYGKTDVKGVVN